MAEYARDDRQFLALFESERRARMAQIMEPLAREPSRHQRRLTGIVDRQNAAVAQ